MQKTLSIAFETKLYSPRNKSTRRITQSFICISQGRNDKLYNAASRSPRAIPLFFFTQFSMESNHYEMKPRFQSLSFS